MCADKGLLYIISIQILHIFLKQKHFYTRFLEFHGNACTFSNHTMLQFPSGIYVHLIQISEK